MPQAARGERRGSDLSRSFVVQICSVVSYLYLEIVATRLITCTTAVRMATLGVSLGRGGGGGGGYSEAYTRGEEDEDEAEEESNSSSNCNGIRGRLRRMS